MFLDKYLRGGQKVPDKERQSAVVITSVKDQTAAATRRDGEDLGELCDGKMRREDRNKQAFSDPPAPTQHRTSEWQYRGEQRTRRLQDPDKKTPSFLYDIYSFPYS